MASEDEISAYRDDFGIMVEAGFVAVKSLDESAARRLFNAAAVLNPESTAPSLGIGYIHLNKLEHKKAAAIFKDVVDKEQDNDLAHMLLGMSLLLDSASRLKGEDLVHETMRKTKDASIENLGKVALEWNEKDLKKGVAKKSPFA